VVDLLVGSGVEVLALVRTAEGARRLVDRGAVAVRGDLREPATWAGRVADADLVIHAGLPRMVPPLRSRRLTRLAREAAHAAAVLSDVAVGKDVVMASCALADRSGPLQIAGPARAAEHALRGPGLRVVRLPWAYGPSGFIADVAHGLSMKRFRIVGPGGNRIALIGARDAAAAIMAAAAASPGVYAAVEPDGPTQVELVHHICVGRGALRPDHVPPAMATMTMGGPVVRALTADHWVDLLPPPGFVPSQSWRDDLLAALTPGEPRPPGA